MPPAAELSAAQNLLRQQKVGEAWKTLTPLLAREPDNVNALLLAGRIQLALDQPSTARSYLSLAASVAPQLHAAQFLLGFSMYVDNDFRPALEPLLRAQKLRPDDGVTLLYLALTYEGLAETASALQLYPRVLAHNGSAEAALAYARLLFTLHRFSEAHVQIQEALRRDPESREAYYERARLHLEATHYAEAAADGERALTLPGLPQTERALHFLLARAYQKLGKPESASQHRKEFESIPPRLVR